MNTNPTNSQPANFGNVAFWVNDAQLSRRFFSEIVGVPELHAGDRPRLFVFYGEPGACTFSINQTEHKHEQRGWARCPMNPALNDSWAAYMTIYVSDLAAVIERCKAAGVPLRQEEAFSLGAGFGISIEVQDPDGNTWALTQK